MLAVMISKPFEGVGLYTQMHNALLDATMPMVSGNAWKILCMIVRQTKGWKRDECDISYKDILLHTGISSRTTISKALDELLTLELIIVSKPHAEYEKYKYSLNKDATIEWMPRNLCSTENGLQSASRSPENGLACSPENGLINKKEENKKKEEERPGRDDGISNALREIYPGYQDDFKTIMKLAAVAHQFNAKPADVQRFPAWLKANHPKRANTPFAFRDHFHESLSAPKPTTAPAASTAPDWYRKLYEAAQ